jgi:Domain of unknown function (DUF397).
MDLNKAEWRKSTYSGGNMGDCVEVATNIPGVVAVRDSKNPKGPTLTFTRDEWRTFLKDVKGLA